MAFTLGFHIILVPFGVAFTFLMLVANYRGIRRGDAHALLLARRWSKVSAVLFAVGAVSGTVLSFEMGLLWPGLMGRYGAAFGLPFGVEGIFFFLEAIFVAIYIYGWDRLAPWPHFWSGVPVTLAGLGGTASVVGQRVDEPAGRDHAPEWPVGRRRPLGRLLQRRLLVRGHPHVPRRLRRRRFRGRRGVRGRHAPGAAGHLPPDRLPHRVHHRRRAHAGADLRG